MDSRDISVSAFPFVFSIEQDESSKEKTKKHKADK